MSGENGFGMSKDDLVKLLDTAEKVLAENQRLVTDDLLNKLEGLIPTVEKYKPVLEAALSLKDEDVERFIGAFKEFIAFEREFIGSGRGPKIINSLERLKGRPVVLALIAKYLE